MSGVNATYTDNIPFSTNNPSSDQPIMEQNTNSINSVLSVDHSAFNTSDSTGGYHSIIHQPVTLNATTRSFNQTTRVFNPVVAAIANVNQLLTANVTDGSSVAATGSQIFNLNSNGGIAQLSGSSASPEGYVWAGGLLFQWGTVVDAAGIGTVTFKDRVSGAIPFPSSCFVVMTTLQNGPFGSIVIPLITNQDFTWAKNTASNFTWFAVGI